jgi:hypothetical protein
MRYVRLVVVGLAAALSACAREEDAKVEAIRSYMREVTGDDLKGPGRLQVTTGDVTTDGRIAKVRGSVKNKFDESVYGIRYVVTIYQQGNPPRVLDRWQYEVDTTLEPGERSAMTLDVESMYFGSMGPVPFNIDAQPMKVGSKDMPPPEEWR